MKKIKIILIYFILVLVALIMIFPMFWMLLLSFKQNPEHFTEWFKIILEEYKHHL